MFSVGDSVKSDSRVAGRRQKCDLPNCRLVRRDELADDAVLVDEQPYSAGDVRHRVRHDALADFGRVRGIKVGSRVEPQLRDAVRLSG